MDGHPSVEYATRRQLKLSSATSLTDCNSFDSLKELKEKYPTAYCNASNGCYYRDGHAVGDYSELLSEGISPYFADDGLEEYEVTVPDCRPCPATATFHTEYGTDRNGNAYTAFTLERSALCRRSKGTQQYHRQSVTVPLKRRKAEKALPKEQD